MIRAWLVVVIVGILPTTAPAQEMIKIVSWNGGALLSTTVVGQRAAHLAKFGEEVKPDILLLQEVTSLEVAKAVRDKMGLTGYKVVCSRFNPGGNGFGALEVAILSKFSLKNVVEYDRSLDTKGPDGDGAEGEKRLERVNLRGIADTGVGRGFLYAKVEGKDLAVIVTHLKSSRGRIGAPDRSNAQKRELVAAAIAKKIAGDLHANPKLTILVGGDFNVGETDTKKNGKKLTEDKTDQSGDGYDDTHALLGGGLIDGLRMISLTKDLGFETYVGDSFPGTGAIDCLCVAGHHQRNCTRAQATKKAYGSDHRAVITHLAFLKLPPIEVVAPSRPVVDGGSAESGSPPPATALRLTKLLPNPQGGLEEEVEKEAAWIKNTGSALVNLTGWKLRDRSGGTWTLSGTINAGQEKEIRRNGMRMSMGNGGDKIELVDPDGKVVDFIEYGRVGQDKIVPHP